MKRFFLLMLVLLTALAGSAAPVRFMPVVRVQPDGDTLRCYVSGDEFFHRLHDGEGYTIVQDRETGEYVYATLHNGVLAPTSYRPGRVSPAEVGLTPDLMPDSRELERLHRRWEVPKQYAALSAKTSGANHGELNNIVIFIRFSDEPSFSSTSFSTIDNKFNDSTAGASSLYNYFKKTSYNKLHIRTYFYPAPSGSTVLSYQDSHARSYYQPYSATNPYGYVSDSDSREREFTLLENAVNWVNANSPVPTSLNLDVDNDGRVDNVCFVLSGTYTGWSDLLWPHKWSLYNRNVYINSKRVYTFNLQLVGSGDHYFGVSTLCHEMTHTLGCPDIYHYNHYTSVSAGGSWDIMNSNQTPPQQTNSLFKYLFLNWFDSIPEITDSGTYTMQSLASGPNHAYKIASANRQQWYILEYRNNSDTFDSSIPGRGMLIWRYNEDPDADNADFDFFDTPHLLWLFRPNSAVDTINGTISSAAFGVYGRNTFNASSNPHPYLADGTPDSSFSLTNIQVSSDHNTVSFTFVPNNNYGCRAVAAMPLVQDFETGSEGCWFSTSITTSNTDRQGVHSSLDGYPTHGGQYSYRFSSYHSSSDYNQYLISPSLPSANPLHLTFYYRRSHTANEQFRVTYSTTTDAPSAFTDTLTDITVTNAGWHLCDLLVPQEAKYIAINYYANYLYYLYIDDISLTDTLTTPSDTIVRDTTYIYLHDTLTLLVHDTLYHHATDTLYYTITDTLYNIIRDTLLTTPERTVLTVASDDPVRGIATGSGTFPIGCTVEIAALPNTGYYFAQWQDGNRDNPRTITVAPDETYTAYFFINGSPTTKEAENTLTEIHDTIILRDTTWIELHDTTWLTHCDTLWIPYPVHDTLWIDHHEVVELDTTTYFTLTAYPLQEGTGIVAGNGVYPVGTVVELAAIPAEGYEFFCWSNGSHENHIQVLIDEDKRLIAAFDEILGTDPVASTTIKAYVENGALVVEAPAGEAITVYNAVGQQMYHSAGSQSYGEINQTVRIPSLHPGFYAVRTGNGSVKKVIIL